MKRFALLGVLGLAACAAEGADPDDYPVEPGTQPGFGDTSTGGGGGDGDEDMLRGRICLIEDLLNIRQCAVDDLAGFTVALGGSTAVTDDRGEFVMTRPTGPLLSFTVTGPNAVTSTTPYSPSLTVPVVDADEWARTLASHQIFAIEGAGNIFGTVVRRGVPASGIEVASSPTSSFLPLFDSPAGFVPDATGVRGVFLLPGVTAGTAGLTLRDRLSGGVTTVAGVPVVNGGITILDSLAIP